MHSCAVHIMTMSLVVSEPDPPFRFFEGLVSRPVIRSSSVHVWWHSTFLARNYLMSHCGWSLRTRPALDWNEKWNGTMTVHRCSCPIFWPWHHDTRQKIMMATLEFLLQPLRWNKSPEHIIVASSTSKNSSKPWHKLCTITVPFHFLFHRSIPHSSPVIIVDTSC